MYIGNNGLVDLCEGLITDCIKLCRTDEITFQFEIYGDNEFKLNLKSAHDLSAFTEQLSHESENFPNFPKLLRIISQTLDINIKEDSKTEIAFSIDKKVIPDTKIDYLKLTEKLLQIAFLNRRCEIITTDKRQEYLIKNYHHFPQGVFYLFDRIIAEALGKPEFEIRFDDQAKTNNYQIGLAYRTDWHPEPNVISFANDVRTICGGSLVDGIMEGLLLACKTFVKENNLSNFKVSKRKLLNGLIIVSAVRGEDYNYGGSFRETLENHLVKKQAKEIIKRLALKFFNENKEKAEKFLWRFDTRELPSGLYSTD